MSQKSYVIDTMISAKSIAARIEQLAHEIETEFSDTDKLVVIGLLRGRLFLSQILCVKSACLLKSTFLRLVAMVMVWKVRVKSGS